MRRLFDAVVPEMGPHLCQESEPVVLIPMAMLLLHRRYLATLVRLGNRPRPTSRHLERKNYVRSPFCAFPTPRCFVQYPFNPISDRRCHGCFTHSPVLAGK